MRKLRYLFKMLFFLWSMLLAFHGQVYSQHSDREIVGIVKSVDGLGLEKVSIKVKGTSNGTITGANGGFRLVVPTSPTIITLVLSHKGFETSEIETDGKENISVVLKDFVENLDEVVVIGYGTAKRKDVTGAIASVQAEKLEKEAPRSIQDLLRGNAAGLVIGQGNSAKGDASLLVRGNGTLKAGNSPLNVVDGVIFDGTFADINPNDIQSIDILKDASATAVYGAKAANGVVLITTKKGKKGKPTITFNGNFGMVENSGMPRVMTADEFLDYRYDYEIGKNNADFHLKYPERFLDPRKLNQISQLDWFNYSQKDPVTSVTEDQLIRTWLSRLELKTPEIENYLNNNITNWQDLVFQKGIQQDYSVAVSNSNETSNYYFSLNHVDREGIIVGNRFRNFRTRLNLETKITSYLKVGANSNFAVRNEGFLQADWAQSAVISPYGSNNIDDPTSLFRRLPTGDVTPVNPFFDNQFRDRKDTYNTLNSSLYAIVNLPFGIELQSNFTPSFVWHEYYNHDSSKNPEWAAKGGSSERTFEKTYNWQMDNVLRWKQRFNIHNFEVTLLQNAEKGQFWRTKATSSQFVPSDILGWHRLQAGTIPINESEDTYKTGDALMARLFYSFKDRYMLTASVRRDGFSAFGSQNPRATFPALAFAWDFTAEEFMKKVSWLDYGKLRVSWGKNGNRDIGMYEALSDMTSGLHPYIDQSGNLYLSSQLYVNRMANLGLKWETKVSYNAGLDFSIFKGKLSGALDFYTATTHDLLVDRSLPEIIGFNSVSANLGELSNKGFDITLNSNLLRKGDFSWNATAIFMLNRRKIVKLYGDMTDIKDEQGNVIGQKEADDIKNKWFIGQDPDRIWAYERNGVWQQGEEKDAAIFGNQPGDFKYVDQNGDQVLSDADRIFQGYTTPRFRWSFRNELSYRNVSFSFFLYSNWGHVNSFNRAANSSNFADRSTDYAFPRWTAANPINDYARIGSKNIGTYYIDKSYIRLENIVLSYNLPKSMLDRIQVQNVRVSASIRNVTYWTKDWKFGDPESSGEPTPRTYNLSLNVTL